MRSKSNNSKWQAKESKQAPTSSARALLRAPRPGSGKDEPKRASFSIGGTPLSTSKSARRLAVSANYHTLASALLETDEGEVAERRLVEAAKVGNSL